MLGLKRYISFVVSFTFLWTNSVYASGQERYPTSTQATEVRSAFDSLGAYQNKNFMDFWVQIRAAFPESERKYIDSWALINSNAKMPAKMPQMSSMKTKSDSGTVGSRLMLNFDDKLVSIEVKGDDSEKFIQVNGAKLSLKDLKLLENISPKITNAQQEFKLSLSTNELDHASYLRMSSQERAVYIINKRLLLEAAQKVVLKYAKGGKETAYLHFKWLQWLVQASSAYADDPKKCVTQGGFIATGDSMVNCNNSAMLTSLQGSLSCANPTDTVCNPMLYGLNKTNSGALCLSAADSAQNKTCGDLAPISEQNKKADIQQMVQSLMKMNPTQAAAIVKYITGQDLDTSKPLERQLFKDMNDYIIQAVQVCENGTDAVKNSKECQELTQRKVSFNSYLVEQRARTAGMQPNRPGGGAGRAASASSSASSFRAQDPNSDVMATNQNSDSCSWFCSLTKWLVSPVGIITAGVLSATALCLTHTLICKKSSTASTATTTGVPTATTAASPVVAAPVVPTAPDYTGGVQ
ncbi:MAG: hypothetical protein ACXWQQ_00475 [Pseudobdellovibrio sp.]